MKEKINNTEIRHRSTFAVLFYINRTKVRKDGMEPAQRHLKRSPVSSS